MVAKGRALRIALPALVALPVLFSAGSMVFIKRACDEHFRRVEQPVVSGCLRYSDVAGCDRTVVQFESGKNTLTGYLCGQGNDKGLVVIFPFCEGRIR